MHSRGVCVPGNMFLPLQIEAMVERGLDAMFEVHEEGGDPNVALFKGGVPKNDDNNADDKENDELENGGDKNKASSETQGVQRMWRGSLRFFSSRGTPRGI
jgi:hypothetical protein